MRFKSLIFLIVIICGCTVKTTITDPDGRMYIVNSRKNAIVSFKKDGADIMIDNRGLHGFISELIGAVAVGNNIARKEVIK